MAKNTNINGSLYKLESVDLHIPRHEELVKVIRNGLSNNFAQVSVTFEECDNLTKEPYFLKSEGICGNQSIIDVGGVKYLLPTPQLSKIYHFDEVAKTIGHKDAFLIGAGAGGHHLVGVNCEMMANVQAGDQGKTGSYIAMVKKSDGCCHLEEYHHKEFCLLGNFLASEGKPGKVLKIKASQRTGDKNFVSCIREALGDHYKDKPVGLGGVFIITKGKAKLHIMPMFSSTPLLNNADVDNWLRFYDMSSSLTCLSVLVSHDPGLDLRVEHTHCFSSHGEGGHYHYDTTPDEVEYEAFYAVAEKLHRIDKPS